MKKLLAVMLVLGIASVSSAAISLVAPVTGDIAPGVYTLEIVADSTAAYDFGVQITPTTALPEIADLMNPLKGPACGDLYGAVDYRGAGYAAWFISTADGDGSTLPNLAAGVRATIDLVVMDTTGEFTVSLLNPDLSVVAGQSFSYVVPEPMTLSLLALGGLGLLRRRR